MSKCHDVIVVGAGPAGARAAQFLATRGLDVLVIERQPWPRKKLCGGGLTPKSYRQIGSDIEDLVLNRADGVHLRAGGTGPFHIRRNDVSIWMVDRQEMDSRLLERALARGASFVDGEAVRRVMPSRDGVAVATEKETYRGRVVVGADGFDSVVAKDMGLRSCRNAKYFLALQTEIRPHTDSLGSVAIVDFGIPFGYAWAFPKGERYSVGVGTVDARRFKDLPSYLDRFVAASGFESAPKTPYRGHKIPIGGGRDRLDGGNVVLVGDAAGMADPLFGEGISYALKSGQLAAAAILEYLSGEEEDLHCYSEAVHETIVKDFEHLRTITLFVHRFPGIAVRLLGMSGTMQNIVAAIISGERSSSSVWREEKDEQPV